MVNALTNEPLKKAQVTLEFWTREHNYALLTDAEGKFRFEGIDPGEYQIDVERQGFLDDSDTDDFEVAPGEHVKDMLIKLTPQGVIDGHVVDEDGDPVPSLQVHAVRTIHAGGRAIALDTGAGITNNEGYFLVSGLKAGRYYLSAEPVHSYEEPPRPGHAGPDAGFVHSEDTVPRDVAAGGALRNVEIQVHRSRVFRIHGHVPNAPASVSIRLTDSDGAIHGNDPMARLHDGMFEFAGIALASYMLRLDSQDLYGRMPVVIADRDIEVTLEISHGPSIQGTIKMDGGASFPAPPSISIHAYQFSSNQNVVASADGSFGWTGLAPVKYVFDYGAPDGCYVKSIRFNGEPVPGPLPLIDLTNGAGGRLEVVVAPNAAILNVSIEGGNAAQVVLWSKTAEFSNRVEAGGTSTFTHLAPGEYQILAWQKIETQLMGIPEFRARFEGQKISLAEGANEHVEVKLIPQSASDAELGKLP